METIKLSSKGQLVLPKPVRESFGWRQGMEFSVEPSQDGVLLRPLRCFEPTRLRDVVGSAGYSGKAISTDEMKDGIRKGMRARRAHGRYNGRR